ncbi:hypothetical protein AEAC466_04510 [Asticcacaulis sp. AC466]|uniref:hypothetical protein n=1 Tax=Asticcacaulis sp. AC466 TaxID=1282362 RepID=UPI0003C3CFC1|nr:hypothetical protein [Asticcacaulis sp. AC466]ESQ85431.1 hypothetical protein AEAC466_04510 [Asticcacaulis sp. AC466]
MKTWKDMEPAAGSNLNRIRVGQTLELFGDPKKKIEKETTIIKFPGGHVEVSRTADNEYWVHVSTAENGQIVDARADAQGRYADNFRNLVRALNTEIAEGVNHIAFRVKPGNLKPWEIEE